MAIKVLAIISSVLAVSQAVKHYGPDPTDPIADGLDLHGWSPKPTLSPALAGLRGLRGKRQQTLLNTCAWFNNAPLDCPANQYCAYNSVSQGFGCCSVDSSGSFIEPCIFQTVCVDQAQSSSLCLANSFTFDCIGTSTAICGEGTHFPECATFILPDGTNSYTSLGCYSEAAVITVATTPPNVIVSTTPTTTQFTTPSTTSPSPPSTTTPTPGPTTTAPFHSTSHTAAIAGGTVGAVAVLAIIGALIGFVVHRMRVKKREAEAGLDSPEMTGVAYVPKS